VVLDVLSDVSGSSVKSIMEGMEDTKAFSLAHGAVSEIIPVVISLLPHKGVGIDWLSLPPKGLGIMCISLPCEGGGICCSSLPCKGMSWWRARFRVVEIERRVEESQFQKLSKVYGSSV
jgi:hypothetical protein